MCVCACTLRSVHDLFLPAGTAVHVCHVCISTVHCIYTWDILCLYYAWRHEYFNLFYLKCDQFCTTQKSSSLSHIHRGQRSTTAEPPGVRPSLRRVSVWRIINAVVYIPFGFAHLKLAAGSTRAVICDTHTHYSPVCAWNTPGWSADRGLCVFTFRSSSNGSENKQGTRSFILAAFLFRLSRSFFQFVPFRADFRLIRE